MKLVCKINIVYGNFKSENSQDYIQKPQRNCTFMNLASGKGFSPHCSEPKFLKLLRSPGIDSPSGGPERQPYFMYRLARLHGLPDSIPWNPFLGSLKVLTNEKIGGLRVISFDRSPFKQFSRKFSKESVQAPSCERLKTTQRPLFLLFANNN
jgi:hypothetical protein